MRLTNFYFRCKIDKYDKKYKSESLQKIARHVLMKRKNMKNISLALASAAVFAAIGGITLKNNVTASAAVQEKSLAEIFTATKATIAPETITEGTENVNVAAFKFDDNGSVVVKRDLALKWFDATGAKYFTAAL